MPFFTNRAACVGVLLTCAEASGCGSSRLQTAGDPGSGGSLSGGGAADAGSAGSSAGGGTGGTTSAAGDGGTAGNPPPVMPDELVGLDDFSASYVSGPASSEQLAVTGMPFEAAWRASMTETPEGPWAAQLIVPLDRAVAVNDLLNVSFWVRCEVPGESGGCTTEFIFEQSSEPWEKSVVFSVEASDTWVEFSEYFRSFADYAPYQAHMLFRLGYAQQVIDIGGVVVKRIPAP